MYSSTMYEYFLMFLRGAGRGEDHIKILLKKEPYLKRVEPGDVLKFQTEPRRYFSCTEYDKQEDPEKVEVSYLSEETLKQNFDSNLLIRYVALTLAGNEDRQEVKYVDFSGVVLSEIADHVKEKCGTRCTNSVMSNLHFVYEGHESFRITKPNFEIRNDPYVNNSCLEEFVEHYLSLMHRWRNRQPRQP